jgi:3-oxoacyl-[acyl-carrier protein] reductase
MSDFSGRRAVVMGGSRGIGRAIALGFAQAGARVAICARGQASLDATRAELGEGAFAASCDLADPAAIARFIPEAAAALGGIDILVNNASGFGSEDDEEGWAASFQVDIMAIVRASHAAEPFLAEAAPRFQGGSSIVNVSSISALRAAARSLPYGAAKAAVDHYTASQARVLGPRLHRIPRRAVGGAAVGGLAGLSVRAGLHAAGATRRAGGSGGCGALPGLPRRALGDGTDPGGGWRPASGPVTPIEIALEEARAAAARGEVPVGAVVTPPPMPRSWRCAPPPPPARARACRTAP